MHHLMKKHLDRTLWKFLLVGAVNTVVGTGIMFVFYNVLHLSYWLSSASNYVFGSVLSYLLNRAFTFQSKASAAQTLPRFVVHSSRRKILRCWWVCVSSWG